MKYEVPDRGSGSVRRFVYRLRTEGSGPVRDALAIGLGIFIGCSPFYGFHLLICWVTGWMLGLNRLKLYLASNISNPFVAPFLLLTELQTGAWIRRGDMHALTVETVKKVDPWLFGADLLVGSVVIGGLAGTLTAVATYLTVGGGERDPFATLVRNASDRYLATSITAWEFARGKLRGDPVYRTVLTAGILPSGGTLVDVGCGAGLTLAMLAEADVAFRQGSWPGLEPPPPVFDALIGIETRARVASIARHALGDVATIVEADARQYPPPRARALLLFDVLHLMPAFDQELLLASMARALEPGGVLLVREADAASGWRFTAVRAGNRLKALAVGNLRQTFHFRTTREWTECFERLGFRVDQRGAGGGTPFGNVLFVLTLPLVTGAERGSA